MNIITVSDYSTLNYLSQVISFIIVGVYVVRTTTVIIFAAYLPHAAMIPFFVHFTQSDHQRDGVDAADLLITIELEPSID